MVSSAHKQLELRLNEVLSHILFKQPSFIIPPFPSPSKQKNMIPSILHEKEKKEEEDEEEEAVSNPIPANTTKGQLEEIDDDFDFSVCEEEQSTDNVQADMASSTNEQASNKRKGNEGAFDVFTAPAQKKRKEVEVENIDPQWRVGKRPGHQGSHSKDPERANVEAIIGQKRSISQVSHTLRTT
jgi:hypothetical protein